MSESSSTDSDHRPWHVATLSAPASPTCARHRVINSECVTPPTVCSRGPAKGAGHGSGVVAAVGSGCGKLGEGVAPASATTGADTGESSPSPGAEPQANRAKTETTAILIMHP